MAFKNPTDLANSFIPQNEQPNDYAFDTSRTARKGTYEWGVPFDNKRLVRMTADDYYKLAANEVNLKWQDLQDQRRAVPNQLSVDEIADKMRKGEKFPTPWIHLNDTLGMIPHFQEGLHRMLAAKDVYGENAKFPVYLGYEKGSEYKDIEDGDMDSFIKRMNDYRRENYIKRENEKYEEELRQKEEDKKLARLWFGLNGQADVTDEELDRYYKEADALFMDDDY